METRIVLELGTSIDGKPTALAYTEVNGERQIPCEGGGPLAWMREKVRPGGLFNPKGYPVAEVKGEA